MVLSVASFNVSVLYSPYVSVNQLVTNGLSHPYHLDDLHFHL